MNGKMVVVENEVDLILEGWVKMVVEVEAKFHEGLRRVDSF